MLDIVHLWNNEVQVFYEGQIVNQKRIYSQRLVRTEGRVYKTIEENESLWLSLGNSLEKLGNVLLNSEELWLNDGLVHELKLVCNKLRTVW